jgi:hypothetical protein
MKKLTLAFQSFLIQKKCPNWKCNIIKNKLICKGNIKPTELSKEYTIKLVYLLGKIPEISVVNPLLEINLKGENSPHLYRGDFLCVYHPLKNEWDSSKVIAETIIPWISLWLYYYEIWQLTGKWKGGGEHPRERNFNNSNRSHYA